MIWWTFVTNLCLVIDFLTITSFIIPLTYTGLLSLSIISVPLNQQRRETLALDILLNLMDETYNYQIALAIKI